MLINDRGKWDDANISRSPTGNFSASSHAILICTMYQASFSGKPGKAGGGGVEGEGLDEGRGHWGHAGHFWRHRMFSRGNF